MKAEVKAPNVRISPHAHELLRKLAEEEDASMQAVLDRAIEQYRRERFLRAANEDYARLRRDKKAWKQELHEREIWDRALADGLGRK